MTDRPVVYERTSRLHWPSIVAGAFVALSLFVISVVLARACDVDVTFQTAQTNGALVGAIIWGGVAAIICFGVGAFVASLNASRSGISSGWLNGLMVWAVAVPILVYFLGAGIGPRLGQTAVFGGGKGPMLASGQYDGTTISQAQSNPAGGMYMRHPLAASWFMLLSLGLGLLSAAGFGAMCSKDRYGGETTKTTTTTLNP